MYPANENSTMPITTNNSTRVKAPDNNIILINGADNNIIYNDRTFLKPKGRSALDRKVECSKLLSCKQTVKVATMNVRTIRMEDRKNELIYNASEKGINILGIVDHKIYHDDTIKYEKTDKYTLITTSAWRNQNQSSAGGLGILLDPKAVKALTEVIKWSKRIMIAHFNGNPLTTVIIHYSPCEGSNEAEDHYRSLLDATTSIPRQNVLLTIGDFNAHVGTNDTFKYTYHRNNNQNGRLLIDYAEETNMMIANTFFRKRTGKLWTFMSDSTGAKTQVDYILIRRKWKNSLHNCEAYSSFSSVGSDHRILTAKLKLSLRKNSTKAKKTQYD